MALRVRSGCAGFLPACAVLALLASGCSPHRVQLSSVVAVGPVRPSPWPAPQIAPPGAPPKIERVWFSTLHLSQGHGFEGAIVTGTNVASVEIRTPVFSINAPRSDFGRFAFKLHILEFPPMMKHTYPMQIIARNTAGTESIADAYLVLE